MIELYIVTYQVQKARKEIENKNKSKERYGKAKNSNFLFAKENYNESSTAITTAAIYLLLLSFAIYFTWLYWDYLGPMARLFAVLFLLLGGPIFTLIIVFVFKIPGAPPMKQLREQRQFF